MRLTHIFLLSALAAGTVQAEQATTLKEAVSKAEVKLDLRYRLEGVSDDNVPDKDALASTLRTSLKLTTAPYRHFQLVIEAENVAAVGNDRLFRNLGAGSASNGVTDRPVVADADSTELNQAYLRFDHGQTRVTLGRQEINLGDQRFVGAVGWRQNHQSFDALSVAGEASDRVSWSYSLLGRVHRIFGGSQGMTSHLANAKFDAGKAGALTAYAYLLDYDDGSAGLSTSTFGAELAGSHKLSDSRKLLYEIELASQQDFADNPNAIDAGYANLMAGYAAGKWTSKIGWESLEGSAEDGQFRTPLATLHKFNGWADKFLGTPSDGLEDISLSLGWKGSRRSAAMVFHDFAANEGSADYGQELDFLLTCATKAGPLIGIKVALYDADELAADTEKLMIWAQYGFD